ncbi:hypothetical protein [Nocardioides pocheonensis]|uniref:Uncharacterized protein n=1 Tax=Nocardioides pocheonensis TaxID=661485 RepID=A0A3N0GUY4_9ACTN|nr:hypothetical protein [Nocardioides pocheonensis]RNM16267.1 hypothetical protein EFL26_05780 [Nocardioides pocheonensis]
MGLDLGRPALTRGRALVLAGVVTAALVVLPGAAATAADPSPAPAPTPGPTQSATVAPPSQQQIDDARSALDRLRRPAKAPKTLAEVSGPTHPKSRSVGREISDQAWWTLGAALLVVLVLSEATRISVRRAKHRRDA